MIRIRYNANQYQEAYSSPGSFAAESSVLKIHTLLRVVFSSPFSQTQYFVLISYVNQSALLANYLFFLFVVWPLVFFFRVYRYSNLLPFLHREEQLSSTSGCYFLVAVLSHICTAYQTWINLFYFLCSCMQI